MYLTRVVFCSPFAFSALLSALSFTSLGTEAAVAVCLAPEENCTAFTVDAIDGTETQILVSAYGLTTSSSFVEPVGLKSELWAQRMPNVTTGLGV